MFGVSDGVRKRHRREGRRSACPRLFARLAPSALAVAAIAVAACGGTASGDRPLRVGVTPVPAGEVLARVLPSLVAEGVTIEVVTFTDYVQPNLALSAGELDANLYQNVPFMEQFNRDRGTRLTAVQPVYWPLMGLYSKRVHELEGLAHGAVVAVANDPTNLGRGLLLLQAAGLIRVTTAAGTAATLADVADNPRGLQLRELEAAQLPRALDDVDAAVINANYALDAGLSAVSDAIFVETDARAYTNVLVIDGNRKPDPRVRALARALTSEPVRAFLRERYRGAVVPVP